MAMTHPRGILFDLDGTLVDSAAGICAAVRSACDASGWPVAPDALIAPMIGLPLREIARAVAPTSINDEAVEAFIVQYRADFARVALPATTLFPDVEGELQRWANEGRRLAIATSKRTDVARAVLRQAGILDLFEIITGGDSVPRGKPHPDMAVLAVALLGLTPTECALVGDTTHDIGMGLGAGLPVYAVSYGVHDRAMLIQARPTAIVDRFADLAAFLG
jgi:2-phosphoglycolate phosphatase